MLYVHIAGSSDTVWDCSTPHQVLVLHSVRCLTLRQPLWRGAQPQDHCSPETQALPKSTRETPARRPRLAAGRTTASLGFQELLERQCPQPGAGECHKDHTPDAPSWKSARARAGRLYPRREGGVPVRSAYKRYVVDPAGAESLQQLNLSPEHV